VNRPLISLFAAASLIAGCQPVASGGKAPATGVELVTAAPHEPRLHEPAQPPPPVAAAAPAKVPGPWDQPYPQRFDPASLPKRLGWLAVKGN
jgi:hypothetical protein